MAQLRKELEDAEWLSRWSINELRTLYWFSFVPIIQPVLSHLKDILLQHPINSGDGGKIFSICQLVLKLHSYAGYSINLPLLGNWKLCHSNAIQLIQWIILNLLSEIKILLHPIIPENCKVLWSIKDNWKPLGM